MRSFFFLGNARTIYNTYGRNRLDFFDSRGFVFFRKKIEYSFMDTDISVKICPAHTQLWKLTQGGIWMRGIRSSAIAWISRSTLPLELLFQQSIPCFCGFNSYV